MSQNTEESSEESLTTTLEDLDLERRFKNLNVDTKNTSIEDGIPSKEDLESFEISVRDNLDLNWESVCSETEVTEQVSVPEVSASPVETVVTEVSASTIETVDMDTSIGVYDQIFNVIYDLLINHVPHLSETQIKIFFAVLVGTWVVKTNKINNISAKYNESAKYYDSSKTLKISPLYPGFFNTDLRVYMLSGIGFNHPHLTDNVPGLASIVNGRTQYWAGISPHTSTRNENRNTIGRGQNYGLYGGTVNLYENIIVDLIDTGFVDTVLSDLNNNREISVAMLSEYTTQWYDLRKAYSLNAVLNNDTSERTLPCITYVSIREAVERSPHETGIMLHPVDSNLNYRSLSITAFNLAKANCRELLKTYAETFRSEVNELDSEDMDLDDWITSVDTQLTVINKACHEF